MGEVALLAMAAHMEMILVTSVWVKRLEKGSGPGEWGPEHAELYQNIVVRSSVRCHV